MTKRFKKVIEGNFVLFYDGDEHIPFDEVAGVLNSLNDENEQLKDALNQRTEQCDKYYEENEQLKSDNKCYVKRYSELFEDYIACKKENEQLKQINQRLNDELQDCMGKLALKR